RASALSWTIRPAGLSTTASHSSRNTTWSVTAGPAIGRAIMNRLLTRHPYPSRMRLSRRIFAIAALAVSGLPLATAQAAQVGRVDIVGLDEAMAANVRLSLSVEDVVGQELTGRRLAYLVREADDEV